MKTMKWLLRREFWENKGSMFWAPLVVGALMVLFVGATVLYSSAAGTFHGKITVDGQTQHIGAAYNKMPGAERQQVVDTVVSGYLLAAAPLFLMLSVIAFFYCLSALSEERRDRSILFWKSLPVSDAETVLSKVVTAALVAPLITIAVSIFVSVLLLLIVGIGMALHGVNMFGEIFLNANFYLAPLKLLGLLPIYFLWALPTIGWLLMVSAWAKSKVFLWAVGVPLVAIAVIKWTDFLLNTGIKVDWFVHHVVARGLLGLIPGAWLPMDHVDLSGLQNGQSSDTLGFVLKQSWLTLTGPNVWIGVIAGAAMIFAAIRLRRWKDEG